MVQNGHKMSEGHKENIRKAAIGRKRPDMIGNTRGPRFKAGYTPWNKGKRGLPQLKVPHLATRGENNPNWRGGTTPTYQRNRYLNIKKNGGSHTSHEWETLKAQYNWTCPHCKKMEPQIKLTKDHIIPVSKGGSDNIENIQPLCRSGNSEKNTTEKFYGPIR